MVYLRLLISACVLIALIELPAQGAETILVLPGLKEKEQTSSLVGEIVKYNKSVDYFQQKKEASIRNYHAAKNPFEKRLWLITAVGDEIGMVKNLALANIISQLQTEDYAVQHRKLVATLSHPRIQNELKGLKAMYNTLQEQNENTAKEKDDNYSPPLLAMLEKQYSIPRPTVDFSKMLILQKSLQEKLQNKLIQLEKCYTQLTLGELI